MLRIDICFASIFNQLVRRTRILNSVLRHEDLQTIRRLLGSYLAVSIVTDVRGAAEFQDKVLLDLGGYVDSDALHLSGNGILFSM